MADQDPEAPGNDTPETPASDAPATDTPAEPPVAPADGCGQ